MKNVTISKSNFSHSFSVNHSFCYLSSEYRSDDCVRIVLDKLETFGYRVISMTGIGQTCIWLLHKDN